MKGCIYKIENPNGRIYIGQTRAFLTRVSYYSKLNCKKQKKLYHSLLKYGFDAHKIEIICIATVSVLNDLEIFFIKKFDSQQNGLNVLSGGTGGRQTEEARRKISEWRKGRPQSEETKIKRALSLKGKKRTPEQIEKLRARLIGKPLSEEHKATLREKAKGRIPPSRKGFAPWNKGLKFT